MIDELLGWRRRWHSPRRIARGKGCAVSLLTERANGAGVPQELKVLQLEYILAGNGWHYYSSCRVISELSLKPLKERLQS